MFTLKYDTICGIQQRVQLPTPGACKAYANKYVKWEGAHPYVDNETGVCVIGAARYLYKGKWVWPKK